MNPQRSATLATAIYPAVIITGWAFVSLTGIGSPRIETATAAPVVERLAPALAASVELAAAPPVAVPTTVLSYAPLGNSDGATTTKLFTEPLAATTPVQEEPQPVVMAALNDPAEVLAAEVQPPAQMADPQPQDVVTAAESISQPVTETTSKPEEPPRAIVLASLGDPAEVFPTQDAAASTSDAPPQEAPTKAARIELDGECMVADACIDQFLWTLYQRTRKEDTIKEKELRKVQIKRKGKLVTVTRSFTKLVENDFTWKDPHAAERVGMSMMDYVIGGMDRSFKLKLFHTLYAAEAAGLHPGITSAFRDDYRQGIASGLKAASNRSYHGGSLRGGP